MQAFLPTGSTPATSAFTCNTCGIKFVSADMQRQHMKTEWHRYNLKRRVAELPSISSDVFAHKILQQQRLGHQETDELGFPIRNKQDKKLPLSGRERLFKGTSLERSVSPAGSVASEFSQFSLHEHLSVYDESETGSEFVESASEYTEEEVGFTTDEEEEEEATDSERESLTDYVEIMPNSYCFYCGMNNFEVERNIKHMYASHGLYIPERSFVEDLEGLLTFLNEVITIDHECLVCGFLGKSLESIRQHMDSKGHCKVPYESEDEKEMVAEFYNFEFKEDTKSKSSKMVTFSENSSSLAGSKRLPTGLDVGHRSSFRYNHPPASLIRHSSDSQKAVALVDRRFAPGLTSTIVSKQEKQIRRTELRQKSIETRRATSKRSNFQAHFRDELLQ